MKAIMVVAVLVLSGCVQKDASGTADARSNLQVYADSARGVVCYSLSGYQDISCVKAAP